MTMYLMLFRQGQTAVSAALSAVSGLYEDNLYLSNLYEYLEQPVRQPRAALRSAARIPATASASRASSSSIPAPTEPGAVGHRSARAARARAWRWSGRTAPARPR